MDENGRVVKADVAFSAGEAALDAEAIRYVKTYRFQPAKNSQGVAVKCAFTQPVEFNLI